MREILYRGKDIAGNWHYGVPLVFTADYVCMTAPHTYNKSVIPETVGQYTGLTDKNGNKIFEGDVVQSVELELKGIIVFDEHCRFMIKDLTTGSTYLLSYNNDIIRVIGNIHDNPELLKGGAE